VFTATVPFSRPPVSRATCRSSAAVGRSGAVTLAASEPGRPRAKAAARSQKSASEPAASGTSVATGTNHSRTSQCGSRSGSMPGRNTTGSRPDAGGGPPLAASQAAVDPGYQAGRAASASSRRATSVRNASRCSHERQVTTHFVAMQLNEVLLAIEAATMSAW
jgi:hypothetical protein